MGLVGGGRDFLFICGEVFCFFYFLTQSECDPLGGTLKQNVQLITFQPCETFILGLKARALGNIWEKKKENLEI